MFDTSFRQPIDTPLNCSHCIFSQIHKVFSIGQQPFFLCCYNAHASVELLSNAAPIKQRGLLNNSADGTRDWEHIMELTMGDVSLLHPVPVNLCGL